MTHCPSIPRLLETRAAELADRPVIVAAKLQPLSYRQLFIQTEEVVQRLNALGIGRSDRVAAILPNGPEMAAAFLTISSAAAFAPLNPGYHANEFEFFLSDLKPAALVVAAGSASPGIAVARDHSIPLIELAPVGNRRAGGFALRGQDQPSRESRAGFAETNDVALILHTSGTTSRAKMVPLTHSNLLASASNIAAGLQLGEEDRCLNIMPLFHIHGLIGAVLSSIVAGSSVVCTPEFGAPEFLNLLETFLPTWYTAVPTMHRAVIEHAKANPRKISHSLRFIRSCSASLPIQVLRDLEARFEIPVVEAYGMTEASHQIASNPLPPFSRKEGSVGKATGTEIAIVSASGRFLSSGETGEIVVRGKGLTLGYENFPRPILVPLSTAGSGRVISVTWMRTSIFSSRAGSRKSSTAVERKFRRSKWIKF